MVTMNIKRRELGLAKRVQKDHQPNEFDKSEELNKAEEFARCSVDEEYQKLLDTLKTISMSIFCNTTDVDCHNEFTTFLQKISGMTDCQDSQCMTYLRIVFRNLGIEDALNGYRTFKEFVEKNLFRND